MSYFPVVPLPQPVTLLLTHYVYPLQQVGQVLPVQVVLPLQGLLQKELGQKIPLFVLLQDLPVHPQPPCPVSTDVLLHHTLLDDPLRLYG